MLAAMDFLTAILPCLPTQHLSTTVMDNHFVYDWFTFDCCSFEWFISSQHCAAVVWSFSSFGQADMQRETSVATTPDIRATCCCEGLSLCSIHACAEE